MKKEETESDSSCSSSVSLDESDVSFCFGNNEEELPYEEVNQEQLKERDFVLCNFIGGKRNQTKYTYLCVARM